MQPRSMWCVYSACAVCGIQITSHTMNYSFFEMRRDVILHTFIEQKDTHHQRHTSDNDLLCQSKPRKMHKLFYKMLYIFQSWFYKDSPYRLDNGILSKAEETARIFDCKWLDDEFSKGLHLFISTCARFVWKIRLHSSKPYALWNATNNLIWSIQDGIYYKFKYLFALIIYGDSGGATCRVFFIGMH